MPSLPPDFWATEQQHLRGVLQPHLTRLAIFGVYEAEKKLAQFGISFDNTLAHADAAAWARQYIDTILQQFGTTTQKGVGEIIAGFAETPGMTMAQLNKQLMDVLDRNQVRAARVAVTEATRAFAAGNNVAYQRAGLPSMAVHAPAHPNCRCGERVVRLGDEWVIVWETNRDELVCTRAIQMPWGIVKGCRDMHSRIISVGPYLGQKLSEVQARKLHKAWDEKKHPRDKSGQFTAGAGSTVNSDGKEVHRNKKRVRSKNYRKSISDLTKDHHWTEVNGIRVTGERWNHARTDHPEAMPNSEVLEQALSNPQDTRVSRKKDARLHYAKDAEGKWWVAVVAEPKDGGRFLLTFHRVARPGK